MKKKAYLVAALVLSVFIVSSCGSGGSGGSSGSDAGSPAPNRTVTGELTGDLSNLSSVRLVKQDDSTAYTAQMREIELDEGAEAAQTSTFSFSFTVPAGYSYTLEVISADGAVAAVLTFMDATGMAHSVFTLSYDPAALNLGDVTVPASTGDPGAPEAQ